MEQKEEAINKPIATVFNQNLYLDDIKDLMPKNLDPKDSIVLVRSIINNWATKQLMLRKAEENNTQSANAEINNLVQDYRQALLINGYKERLVKQQLDTVISEQEIEDYYQENSRNFRLNEELIKTRYLHFAEDLIDRKGCIQSVNATKRNFF